MKPLHRFLSLLLLAGAAVLASPAAARADACSSPCGLQVDLTYGPDALTVGVRSQVVTTGVAQISLTPPVHDGGPQPWFQWPVDTQVFGTPAYEHAPTFTGLAPGTTYYVLVAVNGDRWYETRFSTWVRRVDVTIDRVHINDDSDWGPDTGEMWFTMWVDDLPWFFTGQLKLDTGDTLPVHRTWTVIPSGPGFDVFVHGMECDPPTGICHSPETNDAANVWGSYDTTAQPPCCVLPPSHGTGLPPGHSGYFRLATEHTKLDYEVFGYWDVSFEPSK